MRCDSLALRLRAAIVIAALAAVLAADWGASGFRGDGDGGGAPVRLADRSAPLLPDDDDAVGDQRIDLIGRHAGFGKNRSPVCADRG